MTPGYSGTPLVRKLGIREGFRIRLTNPPVPYRTLVGTLPAGAVVSGRFRTKIDLWHLFTASERELRTVLSGAVTRIRPTGMIWVSWPKKSSGVPSEVTEDTVRRVALPLGLVDVKVCAVDETWSGLKLVIRKALRPRWGS